MLDMVRQLLAVEDEADQKIALLTGATRQQKEDIRRDLRQRKSVPVLEKIKTWLDAEIKLVLPRSPMAEAINYALNQWNALCVYAEHGFLNIDNNTAERALKLIAIGRKNWLFVNNDTFGGHYATLYSLIASAQRHGLNPQAYMTSVLAKISKHAVEWNTGSIPAGCVESGCRGRATGRQSNRRLPAQLTGDGCCWSSSSTHPSFPPRASAGRQTFVGRSPAGNEYPLIGDTAMHCLAVGTS